MGAKCCVTDAVKSFVEHNPGCADIFEELHIDFCCGGSKSLKSACEEKNLEPNHVFQRLVELPSVATTHEADVSDMTSVELVDHLESTHHVYLKSELPRLSALMGKVCQAHSSRHPELLRLQTVFIILREELEPHLQKEERVLFPLIRKLENNSKGRNSSPLTGPIRVMREEHDDAGDLLKEMRALAKDYIFPKDGCQSFQLLYDGLRELEKDTHLHIHKENNILFSLLQ